jgi:dolichol-phosphate mannosyltransferase
VRTLVITPTYNEAVNIEEFLRRTRAALPDADVLVVDDGSPDGTADLAERLGKEVGHVDVLRRTEKQGLGEAYRAGFALGIERGYEILIEIDADLSHDPAVLPELTGKVEEGADLAIGSRYVPGGATPNWPWYRRALSRYGCVYSAFMLRLDARDLTAGYRAYRATALQTIDYASTRANGYGFQIEMTHRLAMQGGKIVEVPIVFTDRIRGTSKMSSRIAIEAIALVTWWGIRDVFKKRKKPAEPQ